jgi:hypothetical protein
VLKYSSENGKSEGKKGKWKAPGLFPHQTDSVTIAFIPIIFLQRDRMTNEIFHAEAALPATEKRVEDLGRFRREIHPPPTPVSRDFERIAHIARAMPLFSLLTRRLRGFSPCARLPVFCSRARLPQ